MLRTHTVLIMTCVSVASRGQREAGGAPRREVFAVEIACFSTRPFLDVQPVWADVQSRREGLMRRISIAQLRSRLAAVVKAVREERTIITVRGFSVAAVVKDEDARVLEMLEGTGELEDLRERVREA